MKPVLLAIALSAAVAWSQPARTGTVERIKVHGKSLEGNLEGDSPDRDVSVWLPPGYKTRTRVRYPVLYLLHGFTDSDDRWFGLVKHWINLPTVLDKALANPSAREMIVVMPNAFTRYQGSMYSNSATTGNWEDFVAGELVSYIDSHYRTLARVSSRGLAGHSMGGYGAMRIGMRHPEVFSSIYLLSPCCMAPPNPQGGANMARAEALKDPSEVEKADFMTKAMLASAAAWSPNPKRPPLFLDLITRDGQYQPEIGAKWAANAPLAMVDQYIANLRRMKAIGFDAGGADMPIAGTIRTLDQILTSYGIAHAFEIYEGNHINHVADRIETKLVPFFSSNLSFEGGTRRLRR